MLFEECLMNRNPSERVTLIVGAGITGLTAAYTIASAGEKCVLLERESTVGGNCRSYVLDDVIFDLGPHIALLNPTLEADKLLLTLLEDEEFISRKGRVAFYAKGKYWSFPPSIQEVLFYPWKYKREIISAYLQKNKNSSNNIDSLQCMIEEKAGHSFYEDIVGPYVLKKTCASGDKIHRDWFLRLDRDIKTHKKTPDRVHPLRSWFYPSKGFGRIPQKLWEKYSHLGGETICNCGPVSFEKNDDRIVSAKVGNRTFPVKDVIWTGTINELNNLIGSGIHPIKYLDTLIICLTYDRKKMVSRPFIYVYYPQKDLIFNRIYYPDHIYGDKNLPDREGICVEVNDFTSLQNLSDNEIVARAASDVEKLGLFMKNALRQQRLFLLKESLPVYELNYEARLQETFKAVHGYQNLYSVGRGGGYFFCQTPAAVNQGLKVAKYVLQNNYKSEIKNTIEGHFVSNVP